jgi:pectin methylesterase-like acyl-CoA thioesterase
MVNKALTYVQKKKKKKSIDIKKGRYIELPMYHKSLASVVLMNFDIGNVKVHITISTHCD